MKSQKIILIDISKLGQGKKAGIYRVVENLITHMQRYNNFGIYFCTSTGNYRLCKKYFRENHSLDAKMFVYPKRINLLSIIIKICLVTSNILTSGLVVLEEVFFKNRLLRDFFKYSAQFLSTFKLFFQELYIRIESNRAIPNDFINQIDIYLSPFHPFPNQISKNNKIKRFVIIHDVIAMNHPEYFFNGFMAQLKKLIDNFDNEDNIICVSESTKRDLLNYREDLIDNNIIVSHLAVANGIKRIRDNDVLNNVKTKFEIGKDNKYLLSVCTLEPRKNLVRIIRNFIELCEEGKIDDTYLVLVGRKGWKYNDLFIERANNSKYLDRIIFTGYVNDEDMSALMSGCLYFIYISLYEGFGLPPLEAMKCGAPVITSNCSSLPEVVGNNALKVDPTNDEEIRSAMYKLYTDENLRNDLSNKSLEQAAKFSWEKATAKIMQFIETVTK